MQEERKRTEKKVEEITQASIVEIDAAMKAKEKDVMTV